MSSGHVSDESLITRVAHGDRTALEILYDRYAAIIPGICIKVTEDYAAAEDTLQDIFWRVWQNASTYESGRGSFTGWLFKIARNLAIDMYRRQRSRSQTITGAWDAGTAFEYLPEPDTDLQGHTQLNLDAQQIRDALTNLPDEQRQVLELAYFYGMTRQEIAEATGEALGTIHTRARLGLRKLRKQLERSETGAL
jgi:RNA polymerase sigma-70 factor (ECF subfamily)